MTHNEIIEQYVEKLGLSLAEAEQLYQDEKSDNLPNLNSEQAKVAKDMARADRKVENTPRKRGRKPDADKQLLIAALVDCLLEAEPDEMEDVTITNPEREIEFRYCGNRYRLTLSKPRKEKVK